jgi:amino acid transporter
MLKDIFALWQNQSDLMKLQYAYAAVAVVTLVAGGLIGLLNENAAWQVLSLTWIVIVALSVNLVSFALINLVPKEKQPKQARRTQSRSKRR